MLAPAFESELLWEAEVHHGEVDVGGLPLEAAELLAYFADALPAELPDPVCNAGKGGDALADIDPEVISSA